MGALGPRDIQSSQISPAMSCYHKSVGKLKEERIDFDKSLQELEELRDICIFTNLILEQPSGNWHNDI